MLRACKLFGELISPSLIKANFLVTKKKEKKSRCPKHVPVQYHLQLSPHLNFPKWSRGSEGDDAKVPALIILPAFAADAR